MCKHTKWERTKAISKEGWEKVAKDRQRAKKRAKRALKTAMVAQFNQMYGRDANDLASWQHLCNALGVKPLPTKIAACKRVRRVVSISFIAAVYLPDFVHELVTNTHVNLVDFIQAPDPEKPVPTFSSEDALSAYTRSARKFFPRGDIKAGSLLRCLLRHIRDD